MKNEKFIKNLNLIKKWNFFGFFIIFCIKMITLILFLFGDYLFETFFFKMILVLIFETIDYWLFKVILGKLLVGLMWI